MTEGGPPRTPEDDDRASGTSDAALERRVELVEHVDRMEDKLRRSRLSAWVWAMAAVYFVGMGFYTGNWPPAGFMASVSGVLSVVSLMIRQSRRDALRDLQQEMEALSAERGAPDPPDRIGDGNRQRTRSERD